VKSLRPSFLDPRAGLAHPAWWLALALLALNDHVLKGAGLLPAWLTGKLSDVAGLVVAPVLLAALLMLGAVLALWSWWEERLERQDTVLPRVLVNPPSAWFSDPPPRVPATQSVTPSVAPAAEPTSEPTSPPTSPPTSEPPPST
jgi:hypothetical protein